MRNLFYLSIMFVFYAIPIRAEYAFDEQTEFYIINEPDPYKVINKIKNVMRNKCKKRGHVFACTNSFISYDLENIQTNKRNCKITHTTFELKSVYRLPKWSNANEASGDIQEKWHKIMEDIENHEKKHGAIHNRHIKLAYEKLSKLVAPCNRLESEVKNIIEEAETEADKEHRQFDSKYGHHQTRFPN